MCLVSFATWREFRQAQGRGVKYLVQQVFKVPVVVSVVGVGCWVQLVAVLGWVLLSLGL